MIRSAAILLYYAMAGAAWLVPWGRVRPLLMRFGAASVLIHLLLLSFLLPHDAGRGQISAADPGEVEVQFVPPGPESIADREATDSDLAAAPNAEALRANRKAVRLDGDPDPGLPPPATGDTVPPTPDTHRNIPPAYPAEAARRGAEGTVGLVIHVSPTGRALGVDVLHSSGTPSLDRAASDRLRTWRFAPARNGDRPVPFDYELNIRFVLGNHL